MQPHQRVLLLVASGVFMSTLDSSMLNVALPSIMESFNSPLALSEWVIIIYLLTITVLLLFWGHLSSRYGQGKIYNLGVLIFAVGSLLCCLAKSITILILFRFIQGVGASMMMAMGPALISSVFPRAQLGKGLGQIGIATSLGLLSGPVISGLLIHWLHWRFIFLITVPVSVIAYLLGRNTPAIAGVSEPLSASATPFDRTGGLLWFAAITLSLLVASHATALCCAEHPQYWLLTMGCLSAISAWVLLFLHESRTAHPLLPLDLFGKRFFSMGLLSATLSFAVLFFVLLLTPFYLRSVQQLSADQTGYVMMALPLCIFFVSPVAGRIYDRIGARIVASLGLVICLISLLLLTTIDTATSPLKIALLLALLGFGQAMFLSPNSAALLSGVPVAQAGVTSSLLATARNMGMLAGTALAGLIFSLYFSELTGGLDMKDYSVEYSGEFMKALHGAFQVAALLAVAGMTASLCRGDKNAD